MSYLGRYTGKTAGNWLGRFRVIEYARTALSAIFGRQPALMGFAMPARVALVGVFAPQSAVMAGFAPPTLAASGRAPRTAELAAEFRAAIALWGSGGAPLALAGTATPSVSLEAVHGARPALSGAIPAVSLVGDFTPTVQLSGKAKGAL